MIYAELVDDYGIQDRGVFLTLGEFLPFRAKGWIGTKEVNDAADVLLTCFCQQCGALVSGDGYVPGCACKE